MEKVTLTFTETFKDALVIGTKNAVSIILAILFWVITIWIPYVNVGTTIAIMTLPIELSKGNIISPFSIFDDKYRRYMGEFFLLNTFLTGAIILGCVFLLIPGIIIAISWSLAFYFMIDKGINPMESITASNNATYGSKMTIFGIKLAIFATIGIVGSLLTSILAFINVSSISLLFGLAYICLSASIVISTSAAIYKSLKNNYLTAEEKEQIKQEEMIAEFDSAHSALI